MKTVTVLHCLIGIFISRAPKMGNCKYWTYGIPEPTLRWNQNRMNAELPLVGHIELEEHLLKLEGVI